MGERDRSGSYGAMNYSISMVSEECFFYQKDGTGGQQWTIVIFFSLSLLLSHHPARTPPTTTSPESRLSARAGRIASVARRHEGPHTTALSPVQAREQQKLHFQRPTRPAAPWHLAHCESKFRADVTAL